MIQNWLIEPKKMTTQEKLDQLVEDIKEATGLQHINYYEGPDLECWVAWDPILKSQYCLKGILGSDCKDVRKARMHMNRSSAGGSLLRKTTLDEPATRMVKKGPRMPQDERKGDKPTNTQDKEK